MGLTNDRTKQGYGYKYAPLDVVIDMLKAPLREVGLGYYFTFDGVTLMITVSDADTGEDIVESSFPILEAKTNQDLGKSITYGKRYLLKTVFNISEVDDIDDPDNASFVTEAAKVNATKKPNVMPKAKAFFN
jgi:hypothetical protein